MKKTITTSTARSAVTGSNSLSYGFIATSDAIFSTVTNWTNAGKVFGRLGVGKMNNPTYAPAYKSTLAASTIQYMWISMFPTGKAITAVECEWDIL
jgi:hypothetical protein